MTLIESLLIFYPLIIPVWQAEPFDNTNIERAESLAFLTKPEVKFQIETFQKLKDHRIRSRIARDLAGANNPEEAVKGLTFCYSIETAESVKLDILTSLYAMRHIAKCADNSMLRTCLDSPSRQMRAIGGALYLDKTGDTETILKALKKETSICPKNMLWRDLVDFATKCPAHLLEELASYPDTITRANAVKILAMATPNTESNNVLSKALEDPEDIVRAMLAQGLASRDSGSVAMLEKLAKSTSIQIRSAAASATPSTERLGMHINFINDEDPEIRRIAAVALGEYKDPSVHAPLINAFADAYKPVRDAAENSLIHLNISLDVLERIANESLQKQPDNLSAIRVLGALKDKRYSDRITAMLKETRDDEMIIRSVTALGQLEHAEAAGIIAAKASSENPEVRQTIATTLGIIKQKSTFDTLRGLADDPQSKVATAAIRSMGWIADPSFTDSLMKAARDVEIGSGNRSFAYWSLARINKPSQDVIRLLKRNALERIIITPLGPVFDSDSGRIAAAMALVELSRNDESAKKAILEVLEKLQTPLEKQDMDISSGLTLQEYARQAGCYLNGETPELMPLPTFTPLMTVEKYVNQ